MKKLSIYSLLIMFAVLVFTSCEEEETADVSRVTYFPEFSMEGDKYYFTQQGSDFQEPGISATEGGEEIDVTISGSVDTDTPGAYYLTYSATNEDGIEASTERIVIVTDGAVAGNDLTGTYAGGYYGDATMTVEKVKDGLYEATDVFGYGAPYPIPATIADLGNGNLVILKTTSPFGGVGLSEGTYTDTALEWGLHIHGYSPFPCTWTKQ